MTEHLTDVELAKTLVEEFDEWNNVTGAIPNGIGWYYECRSILEDGDKKIADLTESLRQQESQLRTALDELRQMGPEGPPSDAFQPGDRVKWIKGEAVRTVIAPYHAYRCTEARGPGESLFEARELELVERAAVTTAPPRVEIEGGELVAEVNGTRYFCFIDGTEEIPAQTTDGTPR